MKHMLLSGFVLLFLAACGEQQQQQRYTQQSPEIETVKQLIANYNNQAYDLRMYADTSKTYYNSKEKVLSKEEVIPYHQANDAQYSSRGFLAEDQEYEMVLTDDGQTWVNCWLDWQGTLKGNGKTVTIPIHLTYQFVDGKIVREVGMWDRTPVVMELQAIEAVKKMSAEEQAIHTTVNNIIKAWNTNDQALMATMMTPNFIRTEGGVQVLNTAEAYGNELMANFHKAFPGLKITPGMKSISGNKAMIYWTARGTNNGELQGNPATGKSSVTQGFSIWTFDENAKATREDAYFDKLSMMTQLGYTLTPPK